MNSPEDILLTVEQGREWTPEAAEQHCRLLEEGRILMFDSSPFDFAAADIDYLLSQRQSGTQYHKNIAYRPLQDRVTGMANGASSERMREVMGAYSRAVVDFLSRFLAPYAPNWRLDYASFRPFQEKGREVRTRARNDLLHVDNFPTRPTNGDRILRFFTNINPDEERHWITTEGFQTLLGTMISRSHLRYPTPLTGWRRLRFSLSRSGRKLGLPLAARTPYDDFMLSMHHAMKEDEGFQRDCPKIHLKFPPGSCWTVFTDSVPHAALAGQYALEQTFLISRQSMLLPERSPLRIIERKSGRTPLVAG